MKNKYYLVCCMIMRLFPLRKTVFFSSFSDMYNDNPKYISEALHHQYPQIEQIWSVSERTEFSSIPDYVKIVKLGTIKHSYYRMTSQVVIDNYIGNFFFLGSPSHAKWFKLLIRNKQINYSTWHGTPLKHVGKNVKGRENDILVTSSNGFVLNSEYEKNVFIKAFGNRVPILLLGSARNDPLFKGEKYREITRKKLKLADGINYILFAPTFRGGMSSIPTDTIAISIENVRRITSAMSKKFGGKWTFIYRAHQKYSGNMKEFFKNGEVINGNLYNDMAEYLVATDALITDYSGSLFDYAFTDKPCFLYTPDYQEYTEGRGMYLDLDKLPYDHANSIDELIGLICEYDAGISIDKRTRFNDKIGAVDDGKSSQRIADLVIQFLENKNAIIREN